MKKPLPLVGTVGLPDSHAVDEYMSDTGADWGIHPYDAVFRLRTVRLTALESAEIRPLHLGLIDMDMVGGTKTDGPIVLDRDYSVIDGMHRLADAVAAGERTIQAYVRVP